MEIGRTDKAQPEEFCDRNKKDVGIYKDFDDVLELVGSIGNYQRFFLYGLLLPLSVLEAFLGTNLWFLLDEPNHWCYVTGNEDGGYDLETWKNLSIPRKDNGDFSKCEMYVKENMSQVACTSGWEYDSSISDYRSIIIDFDWVCDKNHWATWVLTATNVGRALGTFLLGYLADKIGRKPVFIITLVLFSFGRLISLYFAHKIIAFVVLSLITGMASPMFAISCNTIGLELSGKDYRAWIYSVTWTMLVIGLMGLPALALVTPNWWILGWTTILLGSLSYLLIPWLPESPRWLLSMGKTKEVVVILRKIQKWNGTLEKVSEEELQNILDQIQMTSKEKSEEKVDNSVLKLFSKPRVALHTFLITFTWVINGLLSDALNLNSLNLHGHRYINFILVMLMEIPGGLFGGILSDRCGRRWLQSICFLLCGIACVFAAYFSIVGTTEGGIYVVVLANFAKFVSTMSFLVIYLQATELFPTQYRTTGSGFASTTSSLTIILVPYIVYLGKSSQVTPWVISAVLSFAGTISSAFIPETRNHNLPETLDEAENFGRERKFWSFGFPEDTQATEVENSVAMTNLGFSEENSNRF